MSGSIIQFADEFFLNQPDAGSSEFVVRHEALDLGCCGLFEFALADDDVGDTLEPRQVGVDLIDLLFEQLFGLLLCVACAELVLEFFGVESDRGMYAVELGARVAFAVPDHALGHDRECIQIALELLREYVLAIWSDDDVFLSAGDKHIVIPVQESYVARVEPAFVVENGFCVFGVVVVAHHDGRTAEAYLSDAVVVGAEYLALGERQEVSC